MYGNPGIPVLSKIDLRCRYTHRARSVNTHIARFFYHCRKSEPVILNVKVSSNIDFRHARIEPVPEVNFFDRKSPFCIHKRPQKSISGMYASCSLRKYSYWKGFCRILANRKLPFWILKRPWTSVFDMYTSNQFREYPYRYRTGFRPLPQTGTSHLKFKVASNIDLRHLRIKPVPEINILDRKSPSWSYKWPQTSICGMYESWPLR